MKKFIAITALLCAMCVMFSCDNSSQPPVFKAGDDLAQAIADLKSGETLYVTDDVDLDAPITIPAGKAVVIQLTGDSEIEYEGSGSAFVVEDGGSLVIKGQSAGSGKSMKDGAAGGTVIESNEPVEALFKVGPGATLELENVTLIGENKDNHGLIWFDNPEDVTSELVTKVTLTNVNAVADKSIICPTVHYEETDGCSTVYASGCSHPMNADIVIKGGKFTRTGTELQEAILRKTIFVLGSKLTMEDVEIVSAASPGVEISGSYLADAYPSYYGHNAGTSSIKNCTITNKATAGSYEDKDWMGSAVVVSQSGAVEIEGGTYTGLYAFASLAGAVNPDGRITATGVTFSGSIENVSKTGVDGDGIISVNGTDY